MRWCVGFLLAATAFGGPLDPPGAGRFGTGATPGARARYAESFALLQRAYTRNPSDLDTLWGLADLLDRFGRAPEMTAPVRGLVKLPTLDEKTRAALRGLLGHLLVVEATKNRGMIFVIVNGQIQQGGLAPAQRQMLRDAATHLRAAIRAIPREIRARQDLARALEKLDDKNADEVQRLRNEAAALERRAPRTRPERTRTAAEAERLRTNAEAIEQVAKSPDHGAALLLRRKALVLDYCTDLIPFRYETALFGPVSLLAPPNTVTGNLTRSYRKLDGRVDHVPPDYHAAPYRERRKIVEGLALDPGEGAAAALLAVLAHASARSPLTDAALASLRKGRHKAARKHLPGLLRTALYNDEYYGAFVQRLFVQAAVVLDVKEAAPVLAEFLPDDTDLYCPRDLARALGSLGSAEQADALLKIAADPHRDVYFRRQAVLALGRIAPDRIGEVPDEPSLEVAVAAARYRNSPTDAAKGRILAALGHEHEADDAAAICHELQIREAVPLIEQFLREHEGHYAAADLRMALKGLR